MCRHQMDAMSSAGIHFTQVTVTLGRYSTRALSPCPDSWLLVSNLASGPAGKSSVAVQQMKVSIVYDFIARILLTLKVWIFSGVNERKSRRQHTGATTTGYLRIQR